MYSTTYICTETEYKRSISQSQKQLHVRTNGFRLGESFDVIRWVRTH